jgi:hypothetical protein
MAKKKEYKKSELCPLCGEYMDLICTGHRNMPFVDDVCYPKMCFTCYYVPKIEEQVYNKDGSIKDEIQYPFSHKHLHTPEELAMWGQADNLQQARKSVRAVKKAIKAAGLDGRKAGKPKKKPPSPDTQLPD